jgi:hypothetical protein
MKPDDGYVLDRNGVAPLIYATRSAPNDFERELWAKFWDMANNEALAKKAGVKAMHGQAAYGKLLPNVIYNLVMRSTGEIIIPPPQEFKADTTP